MSWGSRLERVPISRLSGDQPVRLKSEGGPGGEVHKPQQLAHLRLGPQAPHGPPGGTAGGSLSPRMWYPTSPPLTMSPISAGIAAPDANTLPAEIGLIPFSWWGDLPHAARISGDLWSTQWTCQRHRAQPKLPSGLHSSAFLRSVPQSYRIAVGPEAWLTHPAKYLPLVSGRQNRPTCIEYGCCGVIGDIARPSLPTDSRPIVARKDSVRLSTKLPRTWRLEVQRCPVS